MFDDVAPSRPAFFEFVSPVFFDGLGYAEKVALSEEFVDAKCPAVAQYVAAADGYLFIMENGACTCVSSANVKFLAGKVACGANGAGDGKEESVRGECLTEHSGQGPEQQNGAHDMPLASAPQATQPDADDSKTAEPEATPKAPPLAVSLRRRPPKRGGAW